MKGNANQYPFWRPDFTQNPFALPGRGVQSLIEGMDQNKTPIADSRMSDVRVIMVPRVRQDSVNIPQGDRMQSGVGRPGSLEALLNAGIEKQKGVTE